MPGLSGNSGLSGMSAISGRCSPASLRGLVLWLDASDPRRWKEFNRLTLADEDTDPVGAWQTTTPVGISWAIQTTSSKRPTYKTAVPHLLFDGTDDSLTMSDNENIDFGTGDFSLFLVVNTPDTASAIFAKDDFSGSGNGILIYNGGAYTYWNGSAGTGFGANNTMAVLGVVREGTGSGETKLYYNGALANTTTESRTLSNSKSLVIGADSSGANCATGKVHEIVAYNLALPESELTSLSDALVSKWGI